MDIGLPISEEHGSNGRADHGQILQVECRDLDLARDVASVLPLLYEAWLFVQGEDKSALTDITIAGKEHKVTEIEAILYWYLNEGYKVRLACVDTVIVGIIVYNWVFEGMMAIRMHYVRPEYLRTKAGFKLLNSCGTPKQVTFQTRKDLTPSEMFKVTKGREQRLFEDDKLITWLMPWEA